MASDRVTLLANALAGRGLHVVFDGLPAEVERAVRPALSVALAIVPRWAREVRVKWDDANNEHEANVHASAAYRSCCISVCPAFIALAPREREQVLMHELVHLHVSPLHTAALDALHALSDEGSGERALAESSLDAALETVVEDLTMLCRDLLDGDTEPVEFP
ncbi:MAG: hypothetical protein BroJett004_08210 [Planctomycetota bacterium]|nr:MAG: hypothetical protein BroJett004_08210 [Planctomycetota bacterium]